MKKILSIIMAVAILLTSAVSVFASEEKVTFCENHGNFYLTDDGRLYCQRMYTFTKKTKDSQLYFIDENVTYFGSYLGDHSTILYCKKDDNNVYIYEHNNRDYSDFGHGTYTTINLGDITPCFIMPTYRTNADYIVQDKDGVTYSIKFASDDYYAEKQNVPVLDGKVVMRDDEYTLTDKGNLYYQEYLVSKNVIDFNNCLYRTSDNSLYLYSSLESKKIMDNCSNFYVIFGSGSEEKYIAKGNDGMWYHCGDNSAGAIEPDKYVDGNNITPTYYESMIPASQYIYSQYIRFKNDRFVWELDGNLYYNQYEKNGTTKTLKNKTKIADNIIGASGNYFYTANGSYRIHEDKWSFSDIVYKDEDSQLGIDADGNLAYYLDLDYYTSDVYKIKTNGKFVNCSDWAFSELTEADNMGYIDSVKYFDMNSNISRVDFCNMIVDFCETYLGRELSTTLNPFTDTKNEKVVKAFANGIITGISSDEFAPYKKITREQMCAIMTRAAKLLKPGVQFGEGIKFSDMNQVSDWAVEGVNAMSGMGIVKGDGISITPQSNTSVEQAIAMTYRLYNKIK